MNTLAAQGVEVFVPDLIEVDQSALARAVAVMLERRNHDEIRVVPGCCVHGDSPRACTIVGASNVSQSNGSNWTPLGNPDESMATAKSPNPLATSLIRVTLIRLWSLCDGALPSAEACLKT